MNLKEIKALFPIEVEVTDELIAMSDINMVSDCIGANVLKEAVSHLIPTNWRIVWFNTAGYIWDGTFPLRYSKKVEIYSSEPMMEIKTERKITLSLTQLIEIKKEDNE